MLELTIIIAMTSSMFVGFPPITEKTTFKFSVEKINGNQLCINAMNYSNNAPLSDVIFSIDTYDSDILLAGPLLSNESGQVIFEIPNGYDRVNIVGNYSGLRSTYTYDTRFYSAWLSDYLGALGIAIIIFIITAIGAVISKINWKTFLQKIREFFDRDTL